MKGDGESFESRLVTNGRAREHRCEGIRFARFELTAAMASERQD